MTGMHYTAHVVSFSHSDVHILFMAGLNIY
jgi:hypothetical protein